MNNVFCEVPFGYSSEPSQPCAVHLWVLAFVKGREDEEV